MKGENVSKLNTSLLFKLSNLHFSTFSLVPQLNGKNKPLITYVGDSVVLMCKCKDCLPLNWTWYSSNGSVQVIPYFLT